MSTQPLREPETERERRPRRPSLPPLASPGFIYALPVCTNITYGEAMVGGLVLFLWVMAFVLGLFVPTESLRNALLNGGAPWDDLSRVGLVGVCYTLTNVFFLACLSSFLGCMAHRWQVADGSELIPENGKAAYATRLYLSAMLRGFFLYLMFISGFIIVSTETTVTKTEFGQYIRIAGVISVLGFIVGYDPNLLVRLIRRILSLANLPSEPPAPPGETTDREKGLRLIAAPAESTPAMKLEPDKPVA